MPLTFDVAQHFWMTHRRFFLLEFVHTAVEQSWNMYGPLDMAQVPTLATLSVTLLIFKRAYFDYLSFLQRVFISSHKRQGPD